MSSSTGQDETTWMENGARPSVGIPSPKTRQDRTWKSTQGICFGDANDRIWSPPNIIRFSPGPSSRMHSGDDARKLSTSTRRRISDTSSPSAMGNTSSERAYYLERDELLAKTSTFEAPEVQNLLHSELGTPRPVMELRQELESRLAESPRIRIVAPNNSFNRRVRTGPELPGNGSVSGASRAPTLSPGEVDLPIRPTSTAGPDQKVDSRSAQPKAKLPREMKIPLYPSVRQRTIKSTKTQIIGRNPSRALPSSGVSRPKRRMKDPVIISGYANVNTSFCANEARRIKKVQQSLLDLMLEIDRLLRGKFILPEMALKLRDLANEIGFHEDALNGRFHSYRVTRAFLDNMSPPRPGYKINWAICDLERYLIREPFCSFQESQNRLWRAIRSLVSFRTFRIRALGPDRERRSQKCALFRWLDLSSRVTNELPGFDSYLELVTQRLESQYPNADARALVRHFHISSDMVMTRLRSLEHLWLRNGMVTAAGVQQSRDGMWRRAMLRWRKVHDGHASVLQGLARWFALSLLECPQPSKQPQNLPARSQTDLAELKSKYEHLLMQRTSALLKELWWGRRLPQHFEDIIAGKVEVDVTKDALRMNQEPMPQGAESAIGSEEQTAEAQEEWVDELSHSYPTSQSMNFLEEMNTKLKLTEFIDQMIAVQAENGPANSIQAGRLTKTLSKSQREHQRVRFNKFRLKTMTSALTDKERSVFDAYVKEHHHWATKDGRHLLKLKLHPQIQFHVFSDITYDNLNLIIEREMLKRHSKVIKAEREPVYKAMRRAWSSLLLEAEEYPVLDHETADRIFKKWLLEHDEQLLAQVRPEGSSKPRAGAEQALGRVSEDHDRDPVSSDTLDHSLASGLNFQPSQQLAYPDLSTAGCLAEREPLYPVLDVSQSTCGIEDPRTIEKGRSPLGDNCGSPPPSEDAPFCTPLGFHIPKAKLQQAMDAEPTSVGAYWQYTLYQGPEGDKDKVKVHYCKSKDATERICQLFLDEEVLGFDIEWKMNASATDSVKKNVALVQVASEERIALFHIARYPNAVTVDDFVAPTFKRIMESPNVSKVGVSVKGDCTRLRKFMNIESRGIFELSHLYKLVKFSSGDVKKINKVMVNLAQQVQEHLQLPLWKGELRSSDWSQDLNYQQIQYAASDSYAGFQLYHILESKRKALDPTPPRPANAELNLPIRLANGQTVATYEESPETAEESSVGAEPDLPISMEEPARDFLNIEVEDPSPKDFTLWPSAKATTKKQTKAHQLSKTSSTSSAPASPNWSSAPPASNKPLHPNVIEANAWATKYMNSLPADRKPVAKPADLRAYHLWYHQELEITQIASRLRDHPLAISTVAGYILRAIQAEHLPFPRKRVWALVPDVHRSFRVVYKAMIVKRLKEEERAKDNEALGDTGEDGRLRDGGSNEGGGGSQCSRA